MDLAREQAELELEVYKQREQLEHARAALEAQQTLCYRLEGALAQVREMMRKAAEDGDTDDDIRAD